VEEFLFFSNQSLETSEEDASKETMYSPKIREDLVPRIYREAKKSGVKMTVWVNAVIELALRKIDEAENEKTKKEEKR